MSKKIGIIGGMGPAAGCDLYNRIINLTPAKSDQDHIHVILDSNVSIPDRTAYILDIEKKKMLNGEDVCSGGAPIISSILKKHTISNPISENPIHKIIESAKLLKTLNCDAISMPCITAHYFEDELMNCVDIPFISITEAVTNSLLHKNVRKAAILVTDGTLCGKVFENNFHKNNIDIVYPNEAEQQLAMDLIYKYVKNGNKKSINEVYDDVTTMIEHFISQGAQAIVLGCTELPIAFNLLNIQNDCFLDSTLELSKASVFFALK